MTFIIAVWRNGLNRTKIILLITGLIFNLPISGVASVKKRTLLNVSYDPTRELYREINSVFSAYWKEKTGEEADIRTSHGGSGKQARAVIDGLRADIVTLALAYDIDAIANKSRLLPIDWQERMPDKSAPFFTTIVFMVRKGNPKNIRDWDDLAGENISVVTPNPKTSGGARWNYLAAWGYAIRKYGTDENAIGYIKKLYKNVSVLDAGARGASITFTQRCIGDVLITWENEALLTKKILGAGNFEIVVPSISIMAETPVAMIDENVKRNGNQKIAIAYLKLLYTPLIQEIAARNYFRPRLAEIAEKYKSVFQKVKMFTINEIAGSWETAHERHFADGAIFDQIYQKGK